MSRTALRARREKAGYLIVGRAGMDLAPEPPGTGIEEAIQWRASLGGSAANVAVGLARMGANCSLLTALPDDPVGDFCVGQLESFGVGTEAIARIQPGSFGGRASLALTEARVENHRTIIYRSEAADMMLDSARVEAVDFERFSSVILTGTAFAAQPSRSAAFEAVERAARNQIRLILDLDYRADSWSSSEEAGGILAQAAQSCHIVAGNEEEFALLARGLESSEQAAESLARKRRDSLVLFKRGEKGSVSFSGGQRRGHSAFRVDALKPTGAGDAYLSAFLGALDSGHALDEAVARASASAALVVERPGCAPAMPTHGEIDEFLANRSGTSPAGESRSATSREAASHSEANRGVTSHAGTNPSRTSPSGTSPSGASLAGASPAGTSPSGVKAGKKDAHSAA